MFLALTVRGKSQGRNLYSLSINGTFCCKSSELQTVGIGVVLLSRKRKGEERAKLMVTHFRVFSVLFETWVARAGRKSFP